MVVSNRSLTLALAGVLILGFQNCSPTNFTSSASSASKVDTQSTDQTQTLPVPTGDENDEGCDEDGPGPFGTLDVSKVATILLEGSLAVRNVSVSGSSITKVDFVNRTLASELMLQGSARSAIARMSCTLTGTRADVARLERNLKSIRFKTRAVSSRLRGVAAQASLRIIMTDGTEVQFAVDSKSRETMIEGRRVIVAPELEAQLQEIDLSRAICNPL